MLALVSINLRFNSNSAAIRLYASDKFLIMIYDKAMLGGGSVACWTQARKGMGSNRSRDAVE